MAQAKRLAALTAAGFGLVMAQNVTLTATPASINFSYVSGSVLPGAQTATVKASSGTPAYTQVITGINTLWLIATPDSGRLPAGLSLRVNPTGMAVGSYTATVQLTAAGVATPISIPVTLTITSPLPVLSISAASLSFTSPPLQPAVQTLKLSTSGGPIAFTAAASAATWLSVSPASGVVLPGEQAVLTVTVDASNVTPQAAPLPAKITIVASGVAAANKTQNVAISLIANSSSPTITSVWPVSAQLNAAATTVTLRGTNFYAATLAKISGIANPLATTVLSPTVMIAVIPAVSLAAAGTLNILASNPAPGGDSGAVPFAVLSTRVVQAIVSVASNGGSSVSPGELVTLYGANIGPLTSATMADANNDGFVDTTLNGVSVTIDGQAAPLLYVSQNQVSAQVPYTVALGPAKAVAVVNGSITANGTVGITATAPAIFTLDGSGTGPAAALNFNATTSLYSLNQANAPAKPGDIVLLYITGEGDYATALSPRTGLLVPPSLSPFPQLSPLPTVTIGGAAATVQYAGPLVGSVLGLMQINVVVPVGATTGTAVPVIVTIGTAPTQAGVTLSIHP